MAKHTWNSTPPRLWPRELCIDAYNDGTIMVRIYRGVACTTTRYEVELPPAQVAELSAALAAHTWMHS